MSLPLALLLFIAPPDTLHLAQCYRDAAAHYPLHRQLDLQADLAALNVQNLGARYLPAVSVRGQAVYYSDVAELPLDVPGARIPAISHDQYRVALNVDQLLYDGGVTAQQQALEQVRRDLAQGQVQVELYKLREQVNAAFMGALLFEAQAASLRTLEADLRARLTLVTSLVKNGVVLPSNADVLEAELIKNAQQQAEAAANRRAALAVLGELIGRTLPEDAALALPEADLAAAPTTARTRPEYRVFALNKGLLAQQARLAARKNRPTVSAFAETAFGRPPGLNLFDNTFTPFFSAGLRLNWTAWDWHTSRRERQALALQQELVAAQEEAFAQGVRVALQQQLQDIRRLEEQLSRDDEIIALRQRVAAQAASQLQNGVITATDYLAERNAAHQAELTRQLHRIQLAQARVRYLTTRGDE